MSDQEQPPPESDLVADEVLHGRVQIGLGVLVEAWVLLRIAMQQGDLPGMFDRYVLPLGRRFIDVGWLKHLAMIESWMSAFIVSTMGGVLIYLGLRRIREARAMWRPGDPDAPDNPFV